MRGRTRSYSVCSSMASDDGYEDNEDGYSDSSDASMASSRSRGRSSLGDSVCSDYDDEYSSAETSREPSRDRYSPKADMSDVRASLRSNSGLMRVVQAAVARLKKKSGAPVKTIKQEITDKYGVTLAGSHNTQRLNVALKTLQKEGKLMKTQQGYKLVPHGGGAQQTRRKRRRTRAKRGRKKGKKGRGRKRRRRRRRKHGKKKRATVPRGGTNLRRRKGRKGRKRRRRRRRRHGKKHTIKTRSMGTRSRGKITKRVKSLPASRRGGGRQRGIGASTRSPQTRGGNYTPPGARTSPRLPSRNPSRVPSRVPSRMPSRLPSRSHSPARPGFDPRESPPSRDSPGGHMMNSLDDFDL